MARNEHRQLKWCNLGDRTVESMCLPDQKDVAITFEIYHKWPARLLIRAFQMHQCVFSREISHGIFTFSQAKLYPNEHMNEIMDEVRRSIISPPLKEIDNG